MHNLKGRTEQHIFPPKQQAERDWRDESKDIGHNPFPYLSANWYQYRAAYEDCRGWAMLADQQIAAMGGEPTGPYATEGGE